ncbi:MAG: EAL domain-containing protein [[Eubacterium] siraeum]
MMINYADFAFQSKSTRQYKREFSAEECSRINSYSDSKLLTGLIDENDFSYCFQPIVSTVDGSVYAYEALMRPKNSSPLEILRIAREHGRLYDIERLTFENVLEIISANRARFGEKKIFINSIPDSMITEYDFNRLCEKYGNIMPQLVIEFTEQADLTGDKIASLRHLFKSKGCMIAIDDYGSGYSNTAAVLSLQPDVIKVDRSLIADINTNVKKQHFLTGIIDFARLNNIKVLAEGVETYDEMSVTIRRGVDYIQGFYTAKPQKEIVPDIPDAVAEQMRMLNMCRPEIKRLVITSSTTVARHLDIEKCFQTDTQEL